MSDTATHDLVQRLRALLEPGDIELAGMIVHTSLGSADDIALYDRTLEIGDLVAEAAGVEDWYVYSGNDDSAFASNQHQGLGLADDSFVWECQHLLRNGRFEIVIYYEAHAHEATLDAVRSAGYDVTGVRTGEAEGLNDRLEDHSDH